MWHTGGHTQHEGHIRRTQKHNGLLLLLCRFLERYKHGQGLATPERQGSVTVIRVDGAGVIHDVTPGFGQQGQNPGQSSADAKASRYGCGPISVELANRGASKGSSRFGAAAAAGGGGGSRRRQRRDGCFGMLSAGADGGGGVGIDVGPEARYLKEYEAKLNPFAEFQVCLLVPSTQQILLVAQQQRGRGDLSWAKPCCSRCNVPP